MKHFIIKYTTVLSLVTLVVSQTACKREYANPNEPTEEQVFGSPRGLTGALVGLQRIYTYGRASNLYNRITINGLLTNELIVVNPGNTAEVQLATGGNSVDGNHSMLTTFWSNLNKITFDADRIITAAANLSDRNYASGVVAYASIFKALALGDLSMFWEKIPASNGENVSFIDRIDGFKKAIAAIDVALAAISANAISTTFIANMPPGIDILNTLHALKARYSLFAGLYTQAIASANMVNLPTRSTFNFDNISLNPLFEVATSTNNVVQPKDSTLGLAPPFSPDRADKRVPFYTSLNTSILPRYRINGFGAAATTPIPVYLPGEILLIRAEANARLNNLAAAANDLIIVKAKTSTQDQYGVGAELVPLVGPLVQSSLLDSIYKHRSIELFMSGFKLEDMRRFGRPTSERRRNLMPYPLRERDNNPNTPADPPF